MRVSSNSHGFSVNAVAGSHVVMLGMDMDEEKCPGLMGFAIRRTDHVEDEAYWMKGMKVFKGGAADLPLGGMVSTRRHPIQGFAWPASSGFCTRSLPHGGIGEESHTSP